MATYYSVAATGMTFEVSDNGGTNYTRVQNVTSVDITPIARTETTTETLDNDPVVSVGSAQPSDISVGVNSTPASKGFRICTKAYRDANRVLMRVKTKANRVIDNATATRTLALAVPGANEVLATITGVNTQFTSAPWQPGQAIKLDNITFVIEEVTDATHLKVSRPDGMAFSAITADDDWELWEYGVQWVTNVEVLNAGGASFATGGTPVTDTLTLKSVGVMGDPTLLVTTV